jgi:hypothetical protein
MASCWAIKRGWLIKLLTIISGIEERECGPWEEFGKITTRSSLDPSTLRTVGFVMQCKKCGALRKVHIDYD